MFGYLGGGHDDVDELVMRHPAHVHPVDRRDDVTIHEDSVVVVARHHLLALVRLAKVQSPSTTANNEVAIGSRVGVNMQNSEEEKGGNYDDKCNRYNSLLSRVRTGQVKAICVGKVENYFRQKRSCRDDDKSTTQKATHPSSSDGRVMTRFSMGDIIDDNRELVLTTFMCLSNISLTAADRSRVSVM